MRRFVGCSVILGALYGQALSSPAHAQGVQPPAAADNAIAEIIVTARRKEEAAQTVPVSITALGGESLKNLAVAQTQDLVRVVPGFTAFPSTRGGSAPSYAVRGQRGGASLTPLLDMAVGIYFDGMNLSRSTGTNQTLYDLQSVQVLKGPQGTLFGRNSTGGALVFESNKPTGIVEGYGQASIGNYDFRDFEGMVNVPLSDTVFLRAAGKISRRSGYTKNVLLDRKSDDLDADSARLALTFKPSDSFESRFLGTYFRSGGAGIATKLYYFDPTGVTAGFGLARPQLIVDLANELAANNALGEREYRARNAPKDHAKVHSIQNTSIFDLSDNLQLKNILGYRRVTQSFSTDYVGGGVVNLFHADASTYTNTITEEFQLIGSSGRLSYLAGAFYFREKGNEYVLNQQNEHFVSPAFLAAAGPAVAAFVAPRFPARNVADTDLKNEAMAVFAHVDYKISDAFTFSGGLRYSKDKRFVDYHNQNNVTLTATSFLCVASGVALPTINRNNCSVERRLGYERLTYDATLSYQMERTLVYVSHRKGYRSGGFNSTPPFLPALELGVSFQPETVMDVELGVKSDFNVGGMAARLNVAGFYQWYKNVQRTTGTVAGGTLRTFVANAAKMHQPGFEAELTLKPTQALTLTAGGTIIRPKFDRFNDTILLAGVPTPIDVSDSRIAFIPYEQFNATVQYVLPLEERYGRVDLNFVYSYQGKQATTDPATNNCGPGGIYTRCLENKLKLPAYSLLSFRANWKNVANKGFDFSVFVNNLTDKFYRNSVYTTISSFGVAAGHIGEPRMFGAALRVPFGAAAE